MTTPLALLEMDYVLGRRGGPAAAASLRDDFEAGAYELRWWADAIFETIAIARARPQLGLADASLIALADRLRTTRIATFDRHFTDLTTPAGRVLQTLPERT